MSKFLDLNGLTKYDELIKGKMEAERAMPLIAHSLAEMKALLISDNIGKRVQYLGEETEIIEEQLSRPMPKDPPEKADNPDKLYINPYFYNSDIMHDARYPGYMIKIKAVVDGEEGEYTLLSGTIYKKNNSYHDNGQPKDGFYSYEGGWLYCYDDDNNPVKKLLPLGWDFRRYIKRDIDQENALYLDLTELGFDSFVFTDIRDIDGVFGKTNEWINVKETEQSVPYKYGKVYEIAMVNSSITIQEELVPADENFVALEEKNNINTFYINTEENEYPLITESFWQDDRTQPFPSFENSSVDLINHESNKQSLYFDLNRWADDGDPLSRRYISERYHDQVDVGVVGSGSYAKINLNDRINNLNINQYGDSYQGTISSEDFVNLQWSADQMSYIDVMHYNEGTSYFNNFYSRNGEKIHFDPNKEQDFKDYIQNLSSDSWENDRYTLIKWGIYESRERWSSPQDTGTTIDGIYLERSIPDDHYIYILRVANEYDPSTIVWVSETVEISGISYQQGFNNLDNDYNYTIQINEGHEFRWSRNNYPWQADFFIYGVAERTNDIDLLVVKDSNENILWKISAFKYFRSIDSNNDRKYIYGLKYIINNVSNYLVCTEYYHSLEVYVSGNWQDISQLIDYCKENPGIVTTINANFVIPKYFTTNKDFANLIYLDGPSITDKYDRLKFALTHSGIYDSDDFYDGNQIYESSDLSYYLNNYYKDKKFLYAGEDGYVWEGNTYYYYHIYKVVEVPPVEEGQDPTYTYEEVDPDTLPIPVLNSGWQVSSITLPETLRCTYFDNKFDHWFSVSEDNFGPIYESRKVPVINCDAKVYYFTEQDDVLPSLKTGSPRQILGIAGSKFATRFEDFMGMMLIGETPKGGVDGLFFNSDIDVKGWATKYAADCGTSLEQPGTTILIVVGSKRDFDNMADIESDESAQGAMIMFSPVVMQDHVFIMYQNDDTEEGGIIYVDDADWFNTNIAPMFGVQVDNSGWNGLTVDGEFVVGDFHFNYGVVGTGAMMSGQGNMPTSATYDIINELISGGQTSVKWIDGIVPDVSAASSGKVLKVINTVEKISAVSPQLGDLVEKLYFDTSVDLEEILEYGIKWNEFSPLPDTGDGTEVRVALLVSTDKTQEEFLESGKTALIAYKMTMEVQQDKQETFYVLAIGNATSQPQFIYAKQSLPIIAPENGWLVDNISTLLKVNYIAPEYGLFKSAISTQPFGTKDVKSYDWDDTFKILKDEESMDNFPSEATDGAMVLYQGESGEKYVNNGLYRASFAKGERWFKLEGGEYIRINNPGNGLYIDTSITPEFKNGGCVITQELENEQGQGTGNGWQIVYRAPHYDDEQYAADLMCVYAVVYKDVQTVEDIQCIPLYANQAFDYTVDIEGQSRTLQFVKDWQNLEDNGKIPGLQTAYQPWSDNDIDLRRAGEIREADIFLANLMSWLMSSLNINAMVPIDANQPISNDEIDSLFD